VAIAAEVLLRCCSRLAARGWLRLTLTEAGCSRLAARVWLRLTLTGWLLEAGCV